MAADFKVVGLAELERALSQLPDKLVNSALRGGLRAGSRIVADQAKANIHSVSGDLAKSVRVKSPSIRGDRVLSGVEAGQRARGKKGNKKVDGPFYARFVEFGTAAHVINAKPGSALAVGGGLVQSVHHPGAAKHPFMRPAIDARANDAVQAFASYVAGRIEQAQLDQADPNA